ncbi:hypothetical protein OHA72_34640 [Dactylosporangium sp. NBC_01737]|uniref:hypothetical protein n=1 Tax=Dactylosporangium sp. NBC_01737 TaxID=2975959 RepID=UPI002E0E2193|nr:hypothetical protein OHA72_34640 [Dactylosporangium sp. NBC_01737]
MTVVLALIMPGGHHCRKLPRNVMPHLVSALAMDHSGGRLTIVDAGHPRLRALLTATETVSREDVAALLQGLSDGRAADWAVDTADGVQRVDYVTADPAPAAGGVRAMLPILALLTAVAPTARAVVRQLLHDQPLAVVRFVDGAPLYRYLGQPAPISSVLVDDGHAFVWDRRGAGGDVVVLDTTAARFTGARCRRADGGEVLPLGVLLSDVDVAWERPDPGDGGPVLAVQKAGGHGWEPVPGAFVAHSGAERGWHVVLDPGEATRGAGVPVSGIMLRGDGHTLVYEPGPDLDLTGGLAKLSAITAGLAGQAVSFGVPETELRSTLDAAAATRQRAVGWLGRRRQPVDRDALDQVFGSLLRFRSDVSVRAGLAEAATRVGVEDIEERTFGAQVVTLLVIERELAQRCRSEAGSDPDTFADALTAYLAAVNQSSSELQPWARQRIVRYVTEFLTRRRLPQGRQLTLTTAAPDPAVWDRLTRRAPWLWWFAEPALAPARGIHLTAAAVVDLLVILRPRQVPVQGTPDIQVQLQPLTTRFLNLYRPAVAGATAALLDALAEALGPLQYDPAHSARMVQALDHTLQLAPELAAAVRERVAAEVEHGTSAEHLLVVRVDDRESARVLLVNLSPRHGLDVRVAGDALRLPPFAVEQSGAAGYCAGPLPVPPESTVEVGDRAVPLDVPRAPLAEGTNVTLPALPADLFRGREEQLARLRRAVGGSGPRAGNLVFGTRRAGKSTLAYQAAQDPRLRGHLWIDLSNTPSSVRDFAAWNRAVCRALARQVRRRLGVTLDETDDFVDALLDLDDALDGGAPVAVVLDELDVLLLPEQGSDGRRAAGRLGNAHWQNLVLIGTVQRFHRSVHEFKTWQSIEVPADLAWADGATYFLGPLADRAAGPRVEWLRRAGVTPQQFGAEIVPRIGLRPYFWARLRDTLEGHVYDDRAGSRLVDTDALRRYLRMLVVEDPHLNAVLDDGTDLDPAERRRRDLFGADERRILARFAVMTETGQQLKVSDAVRSGGEEALGELIDREYLCYSRDRTHVMTAVPIYHEFLRTRVTDLFAVTSAGDGEAVPLLVEDIDTVRGVVHRALDGRRRQPLAMMGQILADELPGLYASGWAGQRTLTKFLAAHLPEFPVVNDAGGQWIEAPH